jgi:hypothetical protein
MIRTDQKPVSLGAVSPDIEASLIAAAYAPAPPD